jgi:hypothetical protein
MGDARLEHEKDHPPRHEEGRKAEQKGPFPGGMTVSSPGNPFHLHFSSVFKEQHYKKLWKIIFFRMN